MICLQCGYMHKNQNGSKEVSLEEVTPKLSSQEEYGKTMLQEKYVKSMWWGNIQWVSSNRSRPQGP